MSYLKGYTCTLCIEHIYYRSRLMSHLRTFVLTNHTCITTLMKTNRKARHEYSLLCASNCYVFIIVNTRIMCFLTFIKYCCKNTFERFRMCMYGMCILYVCIVCVYRMCVLYVLLYHKVRVITKKLLFHKILRCYWNIA